MANPIDDLFQAELKVINLGLEGFARDLEQRDVPVVQVDWQPPAGGDPALAALLAKLGR
jgi:FdrA protein